jgi:hypothetical protein
MAQTNQLSGKTLSVCMKQVFTLILLCATLFGASAQEIFQKALGSTGADYLSDLQRLNDGSYIALGYTRIPAADSMFTQLFKLDSNMNVVWTKTYSLNNQTKPFELANANDGGYFIYGRTWQTPTVNAKSGAFVIKTDANGNAAWSRLVRFDGSESMIKVVQEADNTLRYFVRGSNTSYIHKADATGALTGTAYGFTGGTYDIIFRRVLRMSADRYAVLGTIQGGGDHIVMVNKDTIQWVREYTGILNQPNIQNMVADAAGSLYFTGNYIAGNFNLRNHYVGKLNPDGVPRWTTVLPMIRNGGRGIDTVWRYATGGHIGLRGNRVYVAGHLQNDDKGYAYGMLTAFDTASAVGGGNNWLWARVYGNRTGAADSFARVIILPNGQLIGAGNTGLGGNTATPQYYFVKTTADGDNSCNTDAYSPVELVSSSAFLGINKILNIGIAPALNTLTANSEAVPTTARLPLSTTTTICTATVCPAGTITVSTVPANATVCIGDTLTLRASGGSSYLWSSQSMVQASNDSVVRVPIRMAGNLTFNLSAQPRGNNCFAANIVNATVNSLPSGLPNPINPSTGLARAICLGDSLTLSSGAISTSTVTWGSPTNSFWRAGSAQTNIVVKPATFGLHRYSTRIVGANGCVATGEVPVTVRDYVTPTVSFDPLGCPGPDLTLRAKGNPEGLTPFFDWLIDGTTLINGRREVQIPNAIGKKIQVIMNVGTDLCPTPPLSRQFRSPLIEITCRGVGTNDVDLGQNITVFPNPTEGVFSVKLTLEKSQKVGFVVRNLLGQVVQNVVPQQLNAGEHVQQFILTDVAAGLYLVETRLDEQIVLKKVLVQ